MFSQHQEDKPTVFFYDLEKEKEIIQVENAEVFLTVLGTSSALSDDHPVLFKADPFVCDRSDVTTDMTLSERVE